MKKAQILSAIALALALGIVIPAAGANAIISNNVAGEDVTAKETTKKMNTAIEAGKESCGYRLNTSSNAKEWYYDMYRNLDNQLERSAKAVDAEKETQAGNVASAYDTDIAALDTSLSSWSKNLFDIVDENTNDINTKDYAAVKAFVQANVQKLKDAIVRYSADSSTTTTINAAITKLNGYIDTAETAIKDEEKDQAVLIEAIVAKIKDADTRNNVKYADVVREANSLTIAENGTCSVAKAHNLYEAINYATAMLKSSWGFTSADGEKAIANITKAMNGGTITPDDTPEIPDDTTLKPGNTGLVGSAEGTATTVSIVAGLATALTALGAGVVVYRNARREK